ncbi:unnamed protein product [Echinostoma caproni]|uniref:Uncharacterized protein n=1 Tax=Echinostoma caproni TaxID=27848 RepID=A0A3P8BM68_9TREM|nr:unnamed protein product [Echinostoma caproni]
MLHACSASFQVTVSRCPGFLFSKVTGSSASESNDTNASTTVYGSAAEGDLDAEWTAYHSYRVAPSAQTIWTELRSRSGLVDMDAKDNDVSSSVAFLDRIEEAKLKPKEK